MRVLPAVLLFVFIVIERATGKYNLKCYILYNLFSNYTEKNGDQKNMNDYWETRSGYSKIGIIAR